MKRHNIGHIPRPYLAIIYRKCLCKVETQCDFRWETVYFMHIGYHESISISFSFWGSTDMQHQLTQYVLRDYAIRYAVHVQYS